MLKMKNEAQKNIETRLQIFIRWIFVYVWQNWVGMNWKTMQIYQER